MDKVGISRLEPRDQLGPMLVFVNKAKLRHRHAYCLHIVLAIFRLQSQSWAVVIETCPVKPNVFLSLKMFACGNGSRPWSSIVTNITKKGDNQKLCALRWKYVILYMQASRSDHAYGQVQETENMLGCMLGVRSAKFRMWKAL